MKDRLFKINTYLIALFFIAQPFINMIQATDIGDIQFFGLSVFETFNILIMGLSLLITLRTYEEKRRFLRFIPYLLALAVYLVLHSINTYAFHREIYPPQKPSFLTETYYILRTFLVPLMLLFNIRYSGIRREQLSRIFMVFIVTISFSMVITNLLGIALQNYSEESAFCSYRLFDWFTFRNSQKYSYYDITSKGWFLSGNQMSAVLFMSYPLTLLLAYEKKHPLCYATAFVQGLAMFMLGTKVANLGAMIILLMFLCFWCLQKLLKKPAKGILFVLVILLILSLLFPFSPIGRKFSYVPNHQSTSHPVPDTMLQEAVSSVPTASEAESEEADSYHKKLYSDSSILLQLDADHLSEEDRIFVKNYIHEFCDYYGISPFIINHYDGLMHMDFWVRYLQQAKNNDYRVLKTMILEDICEKNQNPADKFLGMGYTLNYIYTESDYSYQLYIYGWLGLLLLIGPYLAAILFLMGTVLKRSKQFLNVEALCLYAGPAIGVLVAKFSGHVLERTLPLLTIAFLLGAALVYCKEGAQKTRCEK